MLLQSAVAPAAYAAGISISPSSLQVLSNSTQYSAVDARNYEQLTVSFHYNAEKLEAGDQLNYGWKTESGEGLLDTIDGRAESAEDAESGNDETGNVTSLALPASLANTQFQLFFQNTGTTSGTNDQIDISLIQVNGDAMKVGDATPPSAPTASPVPGTYNTPKSVVLASTDDGPGQVKIYYTTDGTTPDKTSQLYTASIEVTASQTIKAIAYDIADNASEVAVLIYIIDTAVPVIENVQYSNAGAATNTDVTVTITTNEAVIAPEGWVKESDTVFKKQYADNVEDSVIVTDLAGNSSDPKPIKVEGIDRVAPTVALNGTVENGAYTGSVSYEAADDKSIQTVTVNGIAAPSSGILSEPGNYTIVATDTASNTVMEQLVIIIISPPAVGEAVAKPPAALMPVVPVSAPTVALPGRSASGDAITAAKSDLEKSIASVSDRDTVKIDGQPEDDDTVLAPSEEGWKLLGIAWYWYALLGGLVGAGWWFFKARYQTSKDEF
ncbi:MAG TPA: chitobiase/beta-hexosaminidase C-terminal domain-containing protein [Candidatus Saccharimonadales bacterium]